jgi:hypothetical protein
MLRTWDCFHVLHAEDIGQFSTYYMLKNGTVIHVLNVEDARGTVFHVLHVEDMGLFSTCNTMWTRDCFPRAVRWGRTQDCFPRAIRCGYGLFFMCYTMRTQDCFPRAIRWGYGTFLHVLHDEDAGLLSTCYMLRIWDCFPRAICWGCGTVLHVLYVEVAWLFSLLVLLASDPVEKAEHGFLDRLVMVLTARMASLIKPVKNVVIDTNVVFSVQ